VPFGLTAAGLGGRVASQGGAEPSLSVRRSFGLWDVHFHKGRVNETALFARMTREELTLTIQSRKRTKKLTWKQIATTIGTASPIVTTAALLGQMRLDDEEAAKAADLLELGTEERQLLTEIPSRGSLPPGPPTDPLIYRFYELVQVYGTTWKALIQEEFGDGIMSAIDFDMQIERQPDPKGDRVKITMSGKFLPYKKY
jgi:cyanate lyase